MTAWEELDTAVERLMEGAVALPPQLLPPLAERYPFLETVAPGDWDFFFSIAALYVAFAAAHGHLDRERMAHLRERLQAKLGEADAQPAVAERAFDLIHALFEKNLDYALEAAESPAQRQHWLEYTVGLWVVANCLALEEIPRAYEEGTHVVGKIAVARFSPWFRAEDA